MKEKIVYNGYIYTRDPDSKTSSMRMYFSRKKYNRFTKKSKRVYLHRVMWEERNGPIPQDCVIHHKDGNSLNNTPNNLDCIPEYIHHRTFHKVHRFRKTNQKICLRCAAPFPAKTIKSRLCDQCNDIIRHSNKEYKKYYGGK